MLRQIDEVHQLSQSALITAGKSEAQACQVPKIPGLVFDIAVRRLLEAAAQAEITKPLANCVQRFGREWPVHAQDELAFQPAAGVVVSVKLIDFLDSFVSTVHQAQQLEVAWEDVAVVLQLMANERQAVLPESTLRRVQQHHRYQRALACLDKRQHFQCLIERTEPSGAQHQRVCFLDEKQLANEKEVKRQQLVGAVYRWVGMLLEGQGDVEAKAVVGA